MNDHLNITTEAGKAAPPAVVALMHLGGMTPADWVTVLTLLYLALQIGLLIPRYREQLHSLIKRVRGRGDE